ncbi:hypothetical protein Q5425_35605 [Amycolatopsis sp. A133]|uniref:hypothetical protein n=1 Tax=Amycolatopsis sp. A133 TaxID=3064472 RepID=UPI0027FF99F6|nr:hypothetical protein [Amycolatopsis sp. A133]MDQ7809082.1 hypothetical protein [Amycolatopsis sp. A133]
MLEQELADPTSAVAFAEKAATPEDVAKVVVAAFAKKPVEVVFPAVGGRVQRLAGALPVLIRRVMPVVEAKGRRARERLVRALADFLSCGAVAGPAG